MALVSGVDIVRLPPARYPDACGALGRAFFEYDLMVYAAPDAKRRTAGVFALYAAILSDCYRFGEIYVTHDVVGAACWLPPGTPAPKLWRQIRAGMLGLPWRFGVRGFRRLLPYDAMAQKLHHEHAPMPHWYLAAIGVEPKRQGQGVGGALMQPILRRADETGVHCYLETHREGNVRLYQKNGFEIVCHRDVPGHPIPIWAMLRKPR